MNAPKSGTSFITSLAKFAAYVFVGWNTIWLSVFGSFMFGLIMLIAIGASLGEATLTPPKLGELEHVWGDAASANQLLVIPVNGVIVGDSDQDSAGVGTGFGGVVNGYSIKAKLREAADRPEVMGVMLSINSPGGTIYGARAIADGIKYYRERSKHPIYTHIQGVGASGAYWAASATDRILADYGSDIGSIGVIMGPFKYYDTVLSESGGLFGGGVLTQNGIETVTLTAGRSKDVGNPYRRLTKDEVQQLQLSVNNEYDNFVQFVSQQRKLTTDKIRNQIGAMIYDNKSAQSLGLIDGSASQEEAYVRLAKAANLDDYQVMRELRPLSFVDSLLTAAGVKPRTAAEVPFNTCNLTQVRLAYHGDVANLCQP